MCFDTSFAFSRLFRFLLFGLPFSSGLYSSWSSAPSKGFVFVEGSSIGVTGLEGEDDEDEEADEADNLWCPGSVLARVSPWPPFAYVSCTFAVDFDLSGSSWRPKWKTFDRWLLIELTRCRV